MRSLTSEVKNFVSAIVPLPSRFVNGWFELGSGYKDVGPSLNSTKPLPKAIKAVCAHDTVLQSFQPPRELLPQLVRWNAGRKKGTHSWHQWGLRDGTMRKRISVGKTKNERQNQLGGMQRPFPRLMASTNRIGPEGFGGLQLTVKAVQS